MYLYTSEHICLTTVCQLIVMSVSPALYAMWHVYKCKLNKVCWAWQKKKKLMRRRLHAHTHILYICMYKHKISLHLLRFSIKHFAYVSWTKSEMKTRESLMDTCWGENINCKDTGCYWEKCFAEKKLHSKFK